jgi:geranylgeranyl diphosphate synthase type II
MSARLVHSSSSKIAAIADPAHERVRSVLGRARSFVEEWLERVLPGQEIPPTRLHNAMKWAVFPGGARARPLLCRLVADVYGGGDDELVGRMAAAVELVHCASLVQDDLPCFDDAATRRGRPACHKEYGDATAILVGDALLTLAFETLANASPRRASEAFRLIGLLTNATGSSNGVIGGQALELEPHEVDLGMYHRQKTAALFRAAAAGGAICCGEEAEVSRWARIGELVGVALQLRDDLEDVDACEDRTGKTGGRDQLLGRPNAALHDGAESTRSRRAVLVDAVRELLGPSTPQSEALHLLVQEVTRPRTGG